MIPDINIGGVLLPGLLVFAIAALLCTVLIIRLLTVLGAYRLFANRPVVELAVFVIIFGLLARYLPSTGLFQ